MDLRIRHHLSKAQKNKDLVSLKKAHELIGVCDCGSLHYELCVLCAEVSLQLGCRKIAQDCVGMFMDGKPPVNQFLCRAYLCQGQLISQHNITTEEDLDKAVMCYLKAIDIAKHKPRYGFLVFNASLLYFQSVRLFLLPGRRQLLVSSLTQVLEALEQVQDEDHMWRAELMTHLVECLFDAGNEPEAAALVKVTSDLIASHEGEVYSRLFSIQVRHNLIDENDVMKHKNTKLLVIYNIQKLKQLKETFRLLTSQNTQSSSPPPDGQSSSPPPDGQSSSPPPDGQSSSPPPDGQSSSPPPDGQSSSPPPDGQSSSPPPDGQSSSPPPDGQSSSPPPDGQSSSPPPDGQSSSPPPDTVRSVLDQRSYMSLADRIELLLELCLVSLRLDQHQVACDCLTELRNTDVTVSQRVMMECVQCEVDLNKNSSRSSVEMRLSVVVRLDALVQAAVRERDARVIQAVCAAQWNTCLPLLQHNLRKKIKKPLLTLTRALETTDSMLLDVLCDVHAVLAAIEEEDDRLEASMKHVKRALQLDHRGLQSHHLSFSSHLLQLRSSLHSSPQRPEDRTAQLIQQAKDVRGRGADRRPLMVSAGITLAPDDFRTVLDADISEDDESQGHLTRLADKAQHHTACVQKVEGHLSGLDKNSDERERVKLWALLVKTSWTYEVFDVCRAACRFCLLYDDGRWKNSNDVRGETGQNQTHQRTQTDLIRLLAEVHFINAQVTVLKLRSEGAELNTCAVRPERRVKASPEDHAHWTLYSDWIKDLSAYATANFLRGAELGAELGEAWLVVNAAVHLWNNNRWMLKTKGHGLLLPTYRRLLALLRHTGHAGEVDLLVLLCDAVAQGLITSAQGDLETHERRVTQLPDDKPKRGRGKASEKSSSTHGPLFDTAVTQDLKKALEVCEYALLMSNGNTELVSMEVRKQLICTWVTVKRLLQQQIGLKLDICDQSKNEAVTAMSRVLVGVEMIQCERNSRLMEFIVPDVSVLVQMTQDCQWSDSVVELYVWTQLALSAHQTHDHDLVMTCTHNALQLEQRMKMNTGALLDMCCVQEMLCSATCVRGQSLIDGVSVDSSRYAEALEMLESSVRHAERAGSWSLCVTAAGHYWNSCLFLLNTRPDRQQLRKPLEVMLQAINNTYNKHTTGRNKRASEVNGAAAVMDTTDSTRNDGDEVKLWVCLYSALLCVHSDSGEWRRGLQLLDEAVRVIPPSTHRLIVFKQRALVKARLGESVVFDMKQICDEGDIICSGMWRRVALCAQDKHQRLTCYQNAITTLQDCSSQWQKVEFLLEFGEWLYFTQCPVADARLQIDWAIDILMFTDTQQTPADEVDAGEAVPVTRPLGLRVNAVESAARLSDVRRLEGLMRAHTLMALTEERSSPKHQHHLLMALSFTLHIWKVSIATAQEVMKDMSRSRSVGGQPVIPSRKDKERPDEKKLKQSSPVEEKSGDKAPEICFPISPEQWAQFECPEEIRQAFCCDSGPYTINTTSICMQKRTLFYLDVLVRELESLYLTPLTFAPLHLAEVIAHDLTQSKSHSHVYRLRIIKNCNELGLHSSSPYCEELQSFTHIPEDEQTRSHKSIISQRNTTQAPSDSSVRDETSVDEGDMVFRRRLRICQLCLEKADVCLTINLHESAELLLTRARTLAEELGDHMSLAKSFHLLAVLANQEHRYSDAVDLMKQAQEFDGDENFWYSLIQTLLTAVAERRGRDAHHQVCEITAQACRSFRSVLERRQNRAGVLLFYITSLEIRCAVVRRQLLCADGRVSSRSDSCLEMLTCVCVKLKHAAAELLQLGYRTHAADATLEHANTLRILAVDAASEEEKQRHLLDSFCLMQTAVLLQEDVISDVLNILPPHQSGWCNLPAVRVCVRLRLALADLGLMMLEIQCADEKRRAIAREMMTSEERAVEEFMRITSDLTSHQREWGRVGQSLGQVILTHLTAVNSLSLDCTETRARTLGMMGKCLRVLAQQRDPLYSSTLWDEPITMSRRCAQHLWCQASETLLQSVTLSLQWSLTHLIPAVCCDLLECHGQFEPSVSGQYLTLLQSSLCCVEMSSALRAVSSDLSMNVISSAVRRECAGLSQVFSHLTINPEHMRILGEMPPNMKILLLQHSQDGCVLYGGFFEKRKSTETHRGKSVNSTGGLMCSKVVKVSVHRSDLLQLHKHLQDFRQLTAQTHSSCTQTEHTDVDVVFRSLVQEMEEYLHPLLSQFDFSCFSVFSSSVSTAASARSAPDKPEVGECVMILADRMLLDLPLEALEVFQADGIVSVSRDFSLQVLHARLQSDEAVESDNKKEVKAGRGVKGRDQSKDIKAVPVNRVLPPHTIPVDTHRFKYVVTAQLEDDGKQTETMSPTENMRAILNSYTPHFTSLWNGFICDPDHTPSLTDLEKLLSSCGAFIYCGTENIFSCVPAHRLTALNMSGCQMVFLFDCGQNRAVVLHPSTQDTSDSVRSGFEGSVGSASLFTLIGCRSVLLNQWSCSAAVNLQNMRSLLDNLLRKGLTSAQAVHVLRSCRERQDVTGKPSSLTAREITADVSSEDCDFTQKREALSTSTSNFIIYGLPNLMVS
ncbi:cilia- and flagella-associated protein 46 isoform X3 [Triplophysa dalaica]|uniref:cilia- and flagella-associated protein 46 isoform X3 n=1 Tax=Triplophysa dalaica TaxID=1582913 RepID=UPI0024E01074|nr:cilia- and flagella-associated protein 46 isoform X3 [Triplophysa dalaica]